MNLFDGLFPHPPIDDYPENMRANVERLRRKTNYRRMVGVLLSALAYCAMVMTVIVIAALIAFATDRTPPTSARVVIMTHTVRPGGELMMRVTVDRKRICQSKITFMIFDGEGKITSTEMPWTDAAGPVGIDAPFVRTITLPLDATPGVSRLRIERSYRCPINPFHEAWPIVAVDPDQVFEIAR